MPALKFPQAPSLSNESFIAPGRYFTAINIHNPSTCKTALVRWKVAMADLDGRHTSVITSWNEFVLRPDEAIEIDTRDIARSLKLTTLRFVKGFAVFESACELDIVAVYTVRQPSGGSSLVPAFHTERVPARRIDACSDLELDVSTGVAEWMLTSSPMTNLTTPCQAVVLPASASNPPWTSQTGALWITARADVMTGSQYPPGWYVFQYCFTLCSGFTNPKLTMSAMVDDAAWVRLNGQWISGTFNASAPDIPWSLNGPPVNVNPITSGFLPGRNCLELVVRNDANNHPTNPAGISMLGKLTAERGKCSEACGCGD